ncbi:MAG: hypothetical protein M1814_001791 [Vezdaea aestivalis]|nr:MAG: hypothetical protein M1814_001791 [Vezdaea aestivalis]
MAMAEPSNGVASPLLPHIHLVSSFRFPVTQHLNIEDALKKLIDAPTIVKDQAPMIWMFLEAPPDGTVFLVWQASQLGIQFASDGYVWADQEVGRNINIGGLTIEVWQHQIGYVMGRDQMTNHARFRFRIIGSADPKVAFDPSLWIIHYAMSEPARRVPINRVQITQQMNQTFNMRRYLQGSGQLIRKEFMLHDRAKWPTINSPVGPQGPQHPQGMHPGMGRPPPGYYAQPHPAAATGPSPAKRQRQTGPAHMHGHGPPAQILRDSALEDEQDISLGDLLDHLTPREISYMRYRHHHEWMEEILASPYQLDQIEPIDLALSLKGNHHEAVKDFFASETPPEQRNVVAYKSYQGPMEPTKLREFEKVAAARMKQGEEELESMKRKHAERMAKMKKGDELRKAEQALRNAVEDPDTSLTPDYWHATAQSASTKARPRPQPKDSTSNAASPASGAGTPADTLPSPKKAPPARVSDVLAKVEGMLKVKVHNYRPVTEVQKGGWQSPALAPESPIIETQDITMTDHGMDGTADDGELGLDDMGVLDDTNAPDKMDIEDGDGIDDERATGEAVLGENGTGLVGDDFDVSGVGDADFDALMGDGDTGVGGSGGDMEMHNSAAGLLDQYYTSNPSSPAVGAGGAADMPTGVNINVNNNSNNNSGDPSALVGGPHSLPPQPLAGHAIHQSSTGLSPGSHGAHEVGGDTENLVVGGVPMTEA